MAPKPRPPPKPKPPKKKKSGPSLWQRFKTWWWGLGSIFFGAEGVPIKGSSQRISNIIFKNFRGILGVIVPLVALPWQIKYLQHDKSVTVLWMWMFWFFLVQPIAVPCTGMIPIFFLPMAGVMSTQDTTKCYLNDNIFLFILASMLHLLLNNSGYDRRMLMWFLCSGDMCQFSGKRLVFKCSMAAFIMSMFCNRLIVTSTLLQYVTPVLMDMQASYGKGERITDFDEVRYIVNNAIQTSSAIGSLGIMHAAYATLAFRAIWGEAAPKGMEYPDLFNYMQWTLYALPLAIVMWLFNVCYHMLLINCFGRRAMTSAAMTQIRAAFLKQKATVPKRMTTHEKLTIFFTVFALIMFFFRWSELMGYTKNGWADFRQPNMSAIAPEPGEGGGGGAEGGGDEAEGGRFRRSTEIVSIRQSAPVIKDAVVAAMFVIALHILPKSLHFLQIWEVDKKSELKDVKPESSILWWRFVDQNTNYGYFFLIGSGIALNWAARESGLAAIIGANLGKNITNQNWHVALFLICIIICILANIMTGVAALVIFLPFVLCAGQNTAVIPWAGKLYLAALGCGVGASLGFISPFMYTPAYFCHHVGKVPRLRMLRYSFLSVLMCMLLLWFSLCVWAPFLWDSIDMGMNAIKAPSLPSKATTAAPPAAP